MVEAIIAGIFAIIGAAISLLGALIQSLIISHNNKKVIKLQTEKEIQMKRYHEKEQLYSDIISFLPQFDLSLDRNNRKEYLSSENKIMFNSFKSRLLLYSTKEVYEEFYIVCEMIISETDDQKRVDLVDKFMDKLLLDLKKKIK